MQTPSIKRRLASLFYELLLLLALLFVASFLVIGLMPADAGPLARFFYRLYLLLVAGAYFAWSWQRGGQTLAMKTWRIRLVSATGGPVSRAQAWKRYWLAVLGGLCLGLGFLWAWRDPDRQFWHDRQAGTRLVNVEDPS